MIEKIILDMLTQDGVSVKKQTYFEQNGQQYPVGQLWRRAYINSINGRIQVQEEIAEPYKSAIFMVWGNTPTVIETIDE